MDTEPSSWGLHGKVYIITGATRGLGRATAERLLAEGARVVVTGRDQAHVDEAVAALSETSVSDNVLGVRADNAEPDSAHTVVDAAVHRWGQVDGALIS